MSDAWRVITGDCLDIMPSLDPGSVRLVFADPPYNKGVRYGPHHNDNMKPAAYLAWCRRWMKLVHGRLTDDGSFLLLIDQEWAHRLAVAGEDLGFHLRQTVTWYETFGVNCTRKFNRCSRALLYFTRDNRRFVFNAAAVNRPSDRQTKYNDKRANPAGKIWDDVWNIPRLAGTHKERILGFKTQLPLKLLRPIVGFASDPGDLVLDPFAGSGTTGVVCVELGRRFVGIEQGEQYAAIASARIAAAPNDRR